MKAKSQKQIEMQDRVLNEVKWEARNILNLDSPAQEEDDSVIFHVQGQRIVVRMIWEGPRTLRHVWRVAGKSSDNFSNVQHTHQIWDEVKMRAGIQNQLDKQ